MKKNNPRAFKFNKFLSTLMQSDPFYAAISRRIRKVESDELPTAGVAVTGDSIIMLWNRSFFENLDPSHVLGVLKHEFLHVIDEHILSRKRDNHMLWNIATDLAINCLIGKNKLPDCALVPGNIIKTDEEIPKSINDFIENLPTHKSAEWYYNKAKENQELSEELEKLYSQQSDGYSKPGSFDDHDGWENKEGVNKEIIKQKIKTIVRDAVIEADRKQNYGQNGWGDVPAEYREKLRQSLIHEVDWKKILTTTLTGARSRTKRNTRTRPNRKYGLTHPGKKNNRQSRVLIAIDNSGSVTNDDMTLFFSELNNGLAKEIDFTVIHFDTMVNIDNIIEWRRNQKIPPHRVMCGGTDFNAPTKFANDNKGKYDMLVILTDGQAPKPTSCYMKRIWVLAPNYDTYFNTSELKIKMSNNEVK